MQITFIPSHVSRNGERYIPDQWIVDDPLLPGGLSFGTIDEAKAYVAMAAKEGN